MHDPDDLDFILMEQDDYEISEELKDLDAESEIITDECIRSMDPSKSDQDDYQEPDFAGGISRRASSGSGSCGNCILYALTAIAVIVAFGYLVSACS